MRTDNETINNQNLEKQDEQVSFLSVRTSQLSNTHPALDNKIRGAK